MNFGDAIIALKKGEAVARSGWNDMHIYLETHTAWIIGSGAFKGKQVQYEPCIVMSTVQSRHQPGWFASQADMLAEDWELVDLSKDSNPS